jgi:hypothetical protein
MQKRTAALIAGASAAVAMTITGVTYASADAPPSASSAREAVRPASAPLASAPLGGDSDYDYKKDYDGRKKDHGKIQINERTYSDDPGACVTVSNPNAAPNDTFNISNDTHRIVQFFNGNNCNAGDPVVEVRPGDSRFGVGGGGVGSFRLIDGYDKYHK